MTLIKRFGGGLILLTVVFPALTGCSDQQVDDKSSTDEMATFESSPEKAGISADGIMEKVFTGIGGRTALSNLSSFIITSKGVRYRTGDGVEPGKGLFKVSSYNLQAIHDIDTNRMRLDYRNHIFSGLVNEVSELILEQSGYMIGKDNALAPPGAWAMESGRWSSTVRTQFLLNPHLLLRRIQEHPDLIESSGEAILYHRLRGEDEVFPMTVNLDLMTGRRELFSDPDWLKKWQAFDLAGTPHELLVINDPVHPVTLYIHPETGHISKLETLDHEWVRGDVSVEVIYEEWEDFNGISFPRNIRMIVAGFPALEVTRAGVQVNTALDETSFLPPEGIAYHQDVTSLERGYRLSQWMQSWIQVGFAKDIFRPELAIRELAEGAYFISVTSDGVNSLVIEQTDGIVVVEAGPQDLRSEAIIDWIDQEFPDKPVTHLIQSHHHVDHAGGIRPYPAVGAEVVVHENAGDYYTALFERPASVILPDMFDRQAEPAELELVPAGGYFRIEDARNPVTVYAVQTIHCTDMVIAYLEKQGMVFNGDLRSPVPGLNYPLPEERIDPENATMPFYQYGMDLANTIELHNLEVESIVGSHGMTEPYEKFYTFMSPYRKLNH